MQSSLAVGFGSSLYYIRDVNGNIISVYSQENKTEAFNNLTLEQISNIGDYLGINFKYIVSSASVEFSSSYYWLDDQNNLRSEYGSSFPAWVYNDNATIKTYVDTYKEKIENKYDVTISNARLIKYEELITLGCDFSSCTCLTNEVITNNRTWLFDTSYWTGTGQGSNSIFQINSRSSFYYEGSDWEISYGVRPVLEISKSEFY